MQNVLQIVLAALVGSLPSLIALVRWRRIGKAEEKELEARANSQKADAVEKLSETVVRLADRLQELECKSKEQTAAIKELGIKLERANKLIKLLLRGVAVLMHQLQELGATPAFVIPVYSDDANLEDLLAEWSKRGGVKVDERAGVDEAQHSTN